MTSDQAKELLAQKELDIIKVRKLLTEHYKPNRDGLSDEELYSYLSNIQYMNDFELRKELELLASL
jgi:hypothetical protein